jgi:hypothetical protein
VAATDTPYGYAPGDPGAGQTPVFNAVAYTNSDDDPATGTTLYGVDASRGVLGLIGLPNGGAGVTTVGTGLGLGGAMVTGFDIVTVGTANFAFLTTAGMMGAPSQLYSVNLTTGTASLVGTVGTANAGLNVQAFAIATVPEPGTWALLGTGLAALAGVARRRRRGA